MSFKLYLVATLGNSLKRRLLIFNSPLACASSKSRSKFLFRGLWGPITLPLAAISRTGHCTLSTQTVIRHRVGFKRQSLCVRCGPFAVVAPTKLASNCFFLPFFFVSEFRRARRWRPSCPDTPRHADAHPPRFRFYIELIKSGSMLHFTWNLVNQWRRFFNDTRAKKELKVVGFFKITNHQ